MNPHDLFTYNHLLGDLHHTLWLPQLFRYSVTSSLWLSPLEAVRQLGTAHLYILFSEFVASCLPLDGLLA